jgi:hypothetical protein
MVLCVMLGTGGWLALGAVPASADLSPTLFDYQGFAPSAGPALNLEGVASASSSAVQLVSDDDEGSVAGAAWYPNQVDVESDWVSQFNFQVPASGSDPEGFAFVIQGASPAELGEPGPGLGYTGISDSLAIEFGLTSNAQYEEPPAPFLSVQTNGTGSNAPYPQYTLGDESAASPGSQTSVLGDGQQHTITLECATDASGDGFLEVYIDSNLTPALAAPISLSSLGLTNGLAWIGLTAGNGGGQSSETANISSWSFGPSHEPAQVGISSAALTGPAGSTATMGPVTVQLLGTTLPGYPPTAVTDATADVPVTLQSSSPGGVFSLTSGGPPVTSITIPAGQSLATFYYGDSQAGAPTITVTPQTAGLVGSTQTETITGGSPASIKLSPATAAVSAGSNQTYQVEAYGAAGNDLGDVTAKSKVAVTGFGTCPDAVCATTPAELGQQTVTAQYQTSGGTLTATGTLTVDGAPSITSGSSATFAAGSAGQFEVTTGAEYPTPSITESGALPGGVSFTDNGDGTADFTGTPAAGSGGAYSITITASNGVSPAATQNLTLTVDEAPSISSASSATFAVGSAGQFEVTTGAEYPVSSISESGALPSGMTFADNGDGTAELSGTPAAGSAGLYPVTITADNGVSPAATQNLTLSVDESPSFTSGLSASFTVGSAGQFQVTTGAEYPVPSLTESGPLPPGLAFTDNGDGTADLTGTPAAGSAGLYPVTITADNGVSPVATEIVNLTIDESPSITSGSSASFTVGSAGQFQVTTGAEYPVPSITESGPLPPGLAFTDDGDGTADLTGTPAAGSAGAYQVTITADNGVSPAATQDLTVTVGPDGSTTSLVVSTSAPVFGAPVTVAASVAAAAGSSITPTGSVTFYDNGTALGVVSVSGGLAVLTTSALQPGVHSITATYSGDANYDPSSAQPASVTVGFTKSCVTSPQSGPLTITAGQAICVAKGGVISGPVTIQSGGALALTGGVISGPVTATDPAALTICAATISGPVTVSGATGPVEIGDASSCAASKISGPVTLNGNADGIQFDGNKISGPVTLTGNVAPGDVNAIEGNTIQGPLSCAGNTPAPTDGGDANSVSGPRSGQCDSPVTF